MFEHFSPKDSQQGLITYLVANSSEDVYEWFKKEPQLPDGNRLFNSYKYSEEDNKVFELYDDKYNIIGEENFKEKMIRLGGEMFDEDRELNDLYYGLTLYGWELVKEGVKPDALQMIKDYGIQIEQVAKSEI